MPYALRILNMVLWLMLSKALQKSTNTMTAGKFLRLTPSIILRSARIWAVVDLPGLNPAWLPRSRGSKYGRIRLRIILLMSLENREVSDIPL